MIRGRGGHTQQKHHVSVEGVDTHIKKKSCVTEGTDTHSKKHHD